MMVKSGKVAMHQPQFTLRYQNMCTKSQHYTCGYINKMMSEKQHQALCTSVLSSGVVHLLQRSVAAPMFIR